MHIISIDPGKTGAIYSSKTGDFYKMPLDNDEVSYKGIYELLHLLEAFDSHVFLERAMPMAMGSKHAFNYGRGFAAIEIAVQQIGPPVTYVEPSKWTKIICEGVDSRLKPKERSKIALERLAPTVLKGFPQNRNGKLHDGCVDAYLIYLYGERVLRNETQKN